VSTGIRKNNGREFLVVNIRGLECSASRTVFHLVVPKLNIDGLVVDHLNGDNFDNRFDNLDVISRRELLDRNFFRRKAAREGAG
jgi:hypothetical protein